MTQIRQFPPLAAGLSSARQSALLPPPAPCFLRPCPPVIRPETTLWVQHVESESGPGKICNNTTRLRASAASSPPLRRDSSLIFARFAPNQPYMRRLPPVCPFSHRSAALPPHPVEVAKRSSARPPRPCGASPWRLRTKRFYHLAKENGPA